VVGTRGGFREDVGWEDMIPCEREIAELMGCDMRVAVDSYPDVKKNEGVRQK